MCGKHVLNKTSFSLICKVHFLFTAEFL